jgi:hypothetical protein
MSTSNPFTGRFRWKTGLGAVALFVAAGLSLAAASQDKETLSSAAVKELAKALQAANLDSIAAPDPNDPGTWVAALYFPGTQLLVVSAKYAAPTLLTEKMAAKNYRDIYIDLNSASVAGTKVFIIDQSCDGLAARPDGERVADSFEHGAKSYTFDGDWKKAKLSEDDYMKAFSDADQKYARILSLLTAQVKSSGTLIH